MEQIGAQVSHNGAVLTKLHQNAVDKERLRNSRLQNRRYERGLADWAEMVRGINGSARSLPQGLVSFWTQASKSIMSIVSSHVQLRGCGLCITFDAYEPHAQRHDGIHKSIEKGVEYFARGYDGTAPGDGYSDNYDPAYDNNIAPRGLSDLGHVVEDHIVDILTGKHEERLALSS